MKLVYWIADCMNDSGAYSIRQKTRKACQQRRLQYGEGSYDDPRKVVIEYVDAFDLLVQAVSEGGAEGK